MTRTVSFQPPTMSPNCAKSTADRRNALLLGVAGTILAGALLLQVPSPLRINTDAIAILKLAGILTDGQPYLIDGVKPIHPIGIPFVYSLMERAGIASAAGFAAFNLLLILVGAIATGFVVRAMGAPRLLGAMVIILALSNFVILKHSVIPVTDIPYFASSLTCLAVLEASQSATARARGAGLVLALGLVICSILVRRVGVALIPAFLWAAWPGSITLSSIKARLIASNRRGQMGLVILVLAGAVIASFIFGRHLLYLPDFWGNLWGLGIGGMLVQTFTYRLRDFGQLLINVPLGKIFKTQIPFLLAGVLLLSLLCAGLVRIRRRLRTSHIYFLCYLAIMFVWPFEDARFWIPVLPLLALLAIEGLASLGSNSAIRVARTAFLAGYACMSLTAMFYTTRITFSGSHFPQLYGGGSLEKAYLQAWSEQPNLDDDAARVIRRYGMDRHSRIHAALPTDQTQSQ